jgi:predicted dehydrogenase
LQRVERELAPLLAERPELALVSYEARLAPGVIEAALEAGCHVLAEKPGCVAVADFARLCQIADSKHRWLMLAFANRSNPEIVAARELVRGGRLGRLYGIELQLVADQTRLTGEGYRRQWFAQKSRAGGGHLAWLGIHWLDLAMYVTGSGLVTATGLTTNIGGTPLDIEDSAVVAFQLENGILGTLTSGYYLPRGYHSRLQVWGLAGLTTVGAGAGEVIQEPPAATPGGYTPFVGAVCRAVASETEPPVTTAESLRAIEGVFAVYRAAETGTTQRWPGEGAGR